MATQISTDKRWRGEHTSWEEPITSPVLLHVNLDHFLLHDVFQCTLWSRCPAQVVKSSKGTQNSSVGDDVDFLAETMMRTPSVIDITLIRTIQIDFQGIFEFGGVQVCADLPG